MGIDDFFKIVTPEGNTLGEYGEEITLKDHKGEQLGMDASYVIYNAIKALKSPKAMTDSRGRPTMHIVTIINKVLAFDKAGLSTLWIFDSPKPNPIKAVEAARREQIRQNAAAKATDAASREKHAFVLTEEIVRETRDLLTYLGVPHMEAPEGVEAEAYGAFLSSGPLEERFCMAMMSGDSDVLLFGGTLLRAVRSGNKTNYVKYELARLLEASGLSMEQFVTMGVAMGTDFNDKVRGVGPKRVIQRVLEGDITLDKKQQEVAAYYRAPLAKVGAPVISESAYDPAKLFAFLEERDFKLDLWRKRLSKYSKAE